MNPIDNLYIVTCTDLHTAIGVFMGAKSALKMARSLTDRGECVFLPVKLELIRGSKVSSLEDYKSSRDVETVELSKGQSYGYL